MEIFHFPIGNLWKEKRSPCRGRTYVLKKKNKIKSGRRNPTNLMAYPGGGGHGPSSVTVDRNFYFLKKKKAFFQLIIKIINLNCHCPPLKSVSSYALALPVRYIRSNNTTFTSWTSLLCPHKIDANESILNHNLLQYKPWSRKSGNNTSGPIVSYQLHWSKCGMGRNSGKNLENVNIWKNFKETKIFWIRQSESVKIILNTA